MTRLSVTILVCLSVLAFSAWAETAGEQEEVKANAPFSPFERGRMELQLGVGYFVSENYFDVFRPQMNDIDATARFGWMLNNPAGWGIFRGNFELLAELFAGGFVKGPGSVIAGTTIFLRYNYIQPNWKVVPYLQFGGGGAYTDADEDPIQRELGSAVSFNLEVGVGSRFFVTEKCALFLEVDYRHLSNAGLAERNVGLNSVGTWLGASFFF